MGKAEDGLSAQMARDGIKLEVLKPRPKIHIGLAIYLQAFFELDTERQIGSHTLGRIPWSKIVQYAEHYGMDVEETVYFIRKMDDAYRDAKARKATNG